MSKKGIRVDRFTWQPGDLVPVDEDEIKGIKPPDEEVEEQEPGGPEICVCPDCGYEEDKERGVPCRSVECPECGAMLVAKVEERAVDFFNQDGTVYVYDDGADFVAERTVRLTPFEAGASVQRVGVELLSGPDGGPVAEGAYKLTFGRGDTVEFVIEGIDALDGRYQLSRIDDAWILRRPVEQHTTYPEEHDIDAAIAEARRLGHDKLLWRETPGSDLRTVGV